MQREMWPVCDATIAGHFALRLHTDDADSLAGISTKLLSAH